MTFEHVRAWLKSLIFLLLSGIIPLFSWPPALEAQEPPAAQEALPAQQEQDDALPEWSEERIALERIKELQEAMVDTGISPEAIRAIDVPDYSTVSDASLALDRQDIVFVVEDGARVLIIPRIYLVWHEILNTTVAGRRASITYCPRTGSLVGFFGQIGKINTTFGNYGRIINGNLVMYDRATGSIWPQILGESIAGPLTGKQLERFPVIWTTWGLAAKYYPTAQVLTRSTGYKRDYGKDPYGSYFRDDTYYTNNFIFYPIMGKDTRLPPKERMLAMRHGFSGLAVRRSAVIQKGVINFYLGLTPMVAFYDRQLNTVRVFERVIKGREMTFVYNDGQIEDRDSNSLWAGSGLCFDGRYEGERLKPGMAFDVMWFAWSSFFPGSTIIE